MKITNVRTTNDYRLLIGLEDGSEINLNLQKKVKSLPYCKLNDLAVFRAVKFEGTAIYWDAPGGGQDYYPLRLAWDGPGKQEQYPLRLTLEDILLYLR